MMTVVDRLVGLFRAPNAHDVVLYGKPGCHLCEDARVMLATLAATRSFTLTEIDIRSDPVLFRRYDIRIPVLVIDGETELEAPLREAEVRRALR
jgi:glutaredoxin